jgi:putative aldouronate transport system substrate-binding protein
MKRHFAIILILLLIPSLLVWAAGEQEGAAGEKEMMTLTVELFDRNNVPAEEGTLLDNRWVNLAYEEMEKRGIKLEFFPVPRSEEASKLNVLMASGDAPDIVETYNRNLFIQYAANGGLTPLDEHIESAGQNIEKYFGEDILKYGRVQGSTYAVPARRASFVTQSCYIRYDWLEKLGLEVPNTIEGLYDTLVAFKKNSDTLSDSQVLPVGMISRGGPQDFILSAFMESPSPEEQAAVPVQLRDGWIDGIKFYNKLYREGLMHPEFVLDQREKMFSEQFVKNQIGFYQCHSAHPWSQGMIQNLRKTVPDAKIMGMPGFKNKSGEYFVEMTLPVGIYNMVPATAKYPQAAITYLDWVINEGGYIFWFGYEGEHYELDGDGIPQAIDEEYNKKTLHYIRRDIAITYNQTAHRDAEMQKNLLQGRFEGVFGQEYLQNLNISANAAKMPYAFSRVIESEVKHGAALSKLANEIVDKLILAESEAQIDQEYQAFVKNYMNSGGEEVIAEKREAFKAEQ